MSGNADKTKPSESEKNTLKMDRRISRTRDTLGDALVELIHEKTFDEITVQEVLDRAGVGRSTFYAHYRDKQDLFLSDVEDFLELMSGLLTRHNVSLKRVAPRRRIVCPYLGCEGFLFGAGFIGQGERCA